MLQATRTRLEKATDAAHARNKATFNPQATTVPKPKPKRRVALGGAVNAATGETIAERPLGHRQSMRKHTVLNTSLTETRLKRSEERKVGLYRYLFPNPQRDSGLPSSKEGSSRSSHYIAG